MPRTEQNPKKRVALRPHLREIEAWVREGRTDAWIADALGTSASSVQSFRSRNGIHRHHGKGTREPEGVFEGVLDHGEGEGWGLWLDPEVAEDPIWREHWAGVESLVVKLAEDRIVLEAHIGSIQTARAEAEATAGSSSTVGAGPEGEVDSRDGAPRELGRVKWFDPDKGYGFLAHPNGPDVFVHHSEVLGDQGGLEQGAEVEYEVGRNDRGLLARGVRLLG
jgi:cold shock CspA family protein